MAGSAFGAGHFFGAPSMGALLEVQVLPRAGHSERKRKRNCMRATECGKEAWSVNHEPMDKNQIEGGADQGERARNREAFVTKGQAA